MRSCPFHLNGKEWNGRLGIVADMVFDWLCFFLFLVHGLRGFWFFSQFVFRLRVCSSSAGEVCSDCFEVECIVLPTYEEESLFMYIVFLISIKDICVYVKMLCVLFLMFICFFNVYNFLIVNTYRSSLSVS